MRCAGGSARGPSSSCRWLASRASMRGTASRRPRKTMRNERLAPHARWRASASRAPCPTGAPRLHPHARGRRLGGGGLLATAVPLEALEGPRVPERALGPPRSMSSMCSPSSDLDHGAGDAGPVLDGRAKADYKKRLEDLGRRDLRGGGIRRRSPGQSGPRGDRSAGHAACGSGRAGGPRPQSRVGRRARPDQRAEAAQGRHRKHRPLRSRGRPLPGRRHNYRHLLLFRPPLGPDVRAERPRVRGCILAAERSSTPRNDSRTEPDNGTSRKGSSS